MCTRGQRPLPTAGHPACHARRDAQWIPRAKGNSVFNPVENFAAWAFPRATDGNWLTTEQISGTVELTLPSMKSSRSGRFRRSLLPEFAAFCGTWRAGGTHFFTAPAAGHWLPQCAARADKNSRTLHHAQLPRAARHAIEATTREQIAHRTSRAAAASAYH